jgi:CRP/FNR family cyclic AMP-dependent transcriptional regulator
VRALTSNVKSLALLDVYGRVARTLLDLAENVDGQMIIVQKLTHQDIADMVGASREMVSRILKDLVSGGYITIKNKRFTINEKLPQGW